jgi:hypothetical protein
MKLLLLASVLMLSACSTVVPVTQPWPEAPGLQSQQTCGELQKLPATASLSDVAHTVTLNYSQYYECVVKLEAWQEWYAKQKQIHEGLK